ncbi:hypothetical protein FACS189429_0830 [Bacteroidia bacterium]|nr:hypothetical protein FACS189429_0830 [Bacteroidia bacterium]
MNKISCGFDVHKGSVFCCILGKKTEKVFEGRFGTLTPELDKLRDTLITYNCGYVAMESTSIYWMPVWNTFQWDFQMKLANPYFIKQSPGRKSDVKDAHRIAVVHTVLILVTWSSLLTDKGNGFFIVKHRSLLVSHGNSCSYGTKVYTFRCICYT